jgi:hypothetical protein
MSFWRIVVRSIAVVFLLMTAAEVFGCELLSSPSCELSSPLSESRQGGKSPGDECFCCCHHVVLGPPLITLAQLEPTESVAPSVLDSAFDFFTPAID